MRGNVYFGHWGLATQKETQIMKSWRWHDTQSVTMISLSYPCNVFTNKKYQIQLDNYLLLLLVWSFVDKLEHERSRWKGGWMAADKPAPSSTLKLPARTNRDLLELWFLQSSNFKKSSLFSQMLSQSFTFSILDYSFEGHPIKIIEDMFLATSNSFQVHHHFASQVVRAHQIIQSDKVSFHRYWHFGTTLTLVGASSL